MRPVRVFTRNPVVCGRKLCTRCGRWRHNIDFPAHRRVDSFVVTSGRCRTCQARDERTARHDAVRGELLREYERIWREGQRRRMGIPPRPMNRPVPVERRTQSFPLEPLRSMLIEWVDRYNATESVNGCGGIQAFALRSGISERQIMRVLGGDVSALKVPFADKLAIGLGTHLELLDLEDVAA